MEKEHHHFTKQPYGILSYLCYFPLLAKHLHRVSEHSFCFLTIEKERKIKSGGTFIVNKDGKIDNFLYLKICVTCQWWAR